MLIATWIIYGVLALGFLAAGLMKLAQPREALASRGSSMAWVEDFTDPSVKLIGAAEVLGAVGLILPRLLRVAPILSPLAAVGLAVVMVAAIVVHLRRKEPFVIQLVLAVLAIVGAIFGFATL